MELRSTEEALVRVTKSDDGDPRCGHIPSNPVTADPLHVEVETDAGDADASGPSGDTYMLHLFFPCEVRTATTGDQQCDEVPGLPPPWFLSLPALNTLSQASTR